MDEFISTAFFLRSYFPENPAIFKSYVPIGHIWSLNVEEHCYILLSLIGLLTTRFNDFYIRIYLTFFSCLCVASFIFYKYHPPSSQTLFVSRTEVAAFPLLLSCTIYMWLAKYKINPPKIIPVISFSGALLISFISKSILLNYLATSLLLATSINTLSIAPPFILKILSNSILRWFGTCSYSIYLWQQLFYFSSRYAHNLEYYSIYAISMSLLIASFSFYFFERPIRRFISGR